MKTILLIATLVPFSLQATTEETWIRLYEEEILAHDLYVALGQRFGDLMPLQNIPHSESRHREVMAEILKREGVGLPLAPVGRRFQTEGLDALYQKWLAEGSKSEVAACRVGMRLEEHDIADLRQAAKSAPDHQKPLAQLERASQQHLRAFHRNLSKRGGTAQPEVLDPVEFQRILADRKDHRPAAGQAGPCSTSRGPRRSAKENPQGPRGSAGSGNGGFRFRGGFSATEPSTDPK